MQSWRIRDVGRPNRSTSAPAARTPKGMEESSRHLLSWPQRSSSARMRTGPWRGNRGNGELGSDPAAGGPAEEVPDGIGAGVPGGKPALELRLSQRRKHQAVLVKPGQKLQGDSDPGPQERPGHGRMASVSGPPAGSPEQEPVHDRAARSGVPGASAGAPRLQPSGQAVGLP